MRYDNRDAELRNYAAWIRFDTGAILLLKTTWAMHMDQIGGTFFLGDTGGLRLTPEFKVFRDEWGYLVDILPNVKPTPSLDLFRREIADFYAAIRKRRPSPIDPEGVLLTNVIIDGIIASSQAGQEVALTVPAMRARA